VRLVLLSLKEFIDRISSDDVIDIRDKLLDVELEPSRILSMYDRNEKAVLFKVRNFRV